MLGTSLIYVTNGYPPAQPILAIKWGATGDITLKDGQETNEGIAWSRMRGGSYQPSPLLYGDLLYICSNNGILTAYNANGRASLPAAYRRKRRRILGVSYRLGRQDLPGQRGWGGPRGEGRATYETLASNPMGEVMMGTPALAKGVLVVRGMKHIFAVAEKPAQ